MTRQSDCIEIMPENIIFDDMALTDQYGDHLESILEKYSQLLNYQSDGWPVGLEVKLAEKMKYNNELNYKLYNKYLYADMNGNPAPFDIFENRVPCELGAHYMWNQTTTTYDIDIFLRLNAILTNSENIQLRTSDIFTTKDRNGIRLKYIEYTAMRIIFDKFTKNSDVYYNSAHKFVICILKFIKFLAIHPLPDGNGRTARILFQVWLHDAGLLNMPLLPLGPIMHAKSHDFVNAFRKWIINNDTRFVFDFMIDCIDTMLNLASNLLFNDDLKKEGMIRAK